MPASVVVKRESIEDARRELSDLEPPFAARSPFSKRFVEVYEDIVADRAHGVTWEEIRKKYFPSRKRPPLRTLLRLYADYNKVRGRA